MNQIVINQIITSPAQLSHVLRSVRKAKALSQQETGRSVGLLQKSISALENHPESSTIDSLFKLLSALGLELIVGPKDSLDGNDKIEGSPMHDSEISQI